MNMQSHRLLGRSGLRVSPISLGTMTFGEEYGWGASREDSRALFDAYVEAGGNFIDTANIYTSGTSEKWLGEFVKESGLRDRLVIATKYNRNFAVVAALEQVANDAGVSMAQIRCTGCRAKKA